MNENSKTIQATIPSIWLTGHHYNFPTNEEVKKFVEDGCPNHFFEDRERPIYPFTKEMLSYPFSFEKSLDPGPEKKVWKDVYSSAFRALYNMEGLISFVSFEIDTSKKDEEISDPGKEWAQIYLTSGEYLMGFSHATRNDKAFSGIADWLEKGWKKEGVTEHLKKWNSPEVWKEFFSSRIQRKMDLLEYEASQLRGQALKLHLQAKSIAELTGIKRVAMSKRGISDTNYEKGIVPEDYQCDNGCTHGIKLWRDTMTFSGLNYKLLCAACLAKSEGVDIPDMQHSNIFWTEELKILGKIGSMILAIPDEGKDTWCKPATVTEAGYNWWRNLPIS